MTSCEVITSLTGTFIGTCSSLISRAPSGCSIFHIHCLPTTWISCASGGALYSARKVAPANQKMKTNAKSVPTVQVISTSRLIHSGRRPRGADEPRR